MSNIPKKVTRIRIGPIAKGILGIVVLSGVIPLLAIAPGLAVAMAPFLRKKKYQPKQAINKSIEGLIRNGILKKTINKKGEILISVTSKGKWESGIRGLDKQGKVSVGEWDGIWRVIIFDVPEHKRSVRQELRRAINLYGFVQLQKSVWVYPYPCDDFVKLIKKHLGISNDVLYMTVNQLENDKHLKKEFRLQ